MEIKTCKFCGAPIVWLKTQNGRPMPCNAAAVKYQENYKGKDVIVLSDGKVIKATVVNPNGGGLAPIVDGEVTYRILQRVRTRTKQERPAPLSKQSRRISRPQRKRRANTRKRTYSRLRTLTKRRKRQAGSGANGNGRRIHRKRLVQRRLHNGNAYNAERVCRYGFDRPAV